MKLSFLMAPVLLSIVLVGSAAQRRQTPAKRPASATPTPTPAPTPSPTPEPPDYGTRPFDMSLTALPAGFSGADVERVYEAFAERFRAEKKDEFETTEQYRQRLERQRAAPVLGDIRADSTVAFNLLGPFSKYDADAGVLSVSVFLRDVGDSVVVRPVERSRRTFPAQNAFGAAFQVTETTADHYCLVLKNASSFSAESFVSFKLPADVATAREWKDSLRALAVVRFVPPIFGANRGREKAATFNDPTAERITLKRLHCQLLELWLYDSRTGKILARKLPAA